MALPETLLARHRPEVAGMTVYGVKITEMTVDELQCMLVLAYKRERTNHEDHLRAMDSMRSLHKTLAKEKTMPTEPPKCKDCKHCKRSWFPQPFRSYEFAKCLASETYGGDEDLVDGSKTVERHFYCSTEREFNRRACGPEGRNFQPKEPTWLDKLRVCGKLE